MKESKSAKVELDQLIHSNFKIHSIKGGAWRHVYELKLKFNVKYLDKMITNMTLQYTYGL